VEKLGKLFVVSAPSGAGKDTVLNAVLARDPNLEVSVSATTRAPRPGEKEGEDYFFLSREEFLVRRSAGQFAEWAEVHDHLYGTPKEELRRRLASGRDVVLELDVQGMFNVKRLFPEAVSIFIAPPSFDALEERLRKRGANTEEDIILRLRNAREELAAQGAFDYVVVNDGLEEAVADILAIVRAERRRNPRPGKSQVKPMDRGSVRER